MLNRLFNFDNPWDSGSLRTTDWGKFLTFGPGSLGRVEPVRCGQQHGACSAGSRCQQQQDGFHDCSRLLSKRKSYLHSLNTQGLGFPLGTCYCLPEGCFSLNSGKVHPQLFPETGRPLKPTTLPSAGRRSRPTWTRRASLLTEEAPGTSPQGGQTSTLPRSL